MRELDNPSDTPHLSGGFGDETCFIPKLRSAALVGGPPQSSTAFGTTSMWSRETERKAMKYAFVFGGVAIIVRYWEERHADVDGGARVEIRRVEERLGERHRPGNAGFSVLPVSDGGVWRADLFTALDARRGEPRHHHHPRFAGGDVGERVYDSEMTADPQGWVDRKLQDLKMLLEESGAGDLVSSVDFDEYERTLPLMNAAIESCLLPPEHDVVGGGA